MSITRSIINGSLELSTIHDGSRVSRVYYGFTQKEARAMFREYLKTL